MREFAALAVPKLPMDLWLLWKGELEKWVFPLPERLDEGDRLVSAARRRVILKSSEGWIRLIGRRDQKVESEKIGRAFLWRSVEHRYSPIWFFNDRGYLDKWRLSPGGFMRGCAGGLIGVPSVLIGVRYTFWPDCRSDKPQLWQKLH